jgi:flagellar biosynthesis protein FlhA
MFAPGSRLARLASLGDLWLVGALFGTILLLILPVHPRLLDALLASSIALSLLVVLVILYLRDPAEFTGFPTLLLFLTLFRLALNVASTRLILLDGFAGNIIEAFGNFVVRGNYVVGLVVFLILVVINFVVITKGAGRIAEVAARFTLDAMPGKQMAIDADLNAGIITDGEARARRKKIEEESDFYGAMDGASKFVRGDAIAAILITLVNVLGGFAIGILQKGMTVGEALQRFTLLSIGDGLVSQIPALITSTAAGILVTRAASRQDLGQDLGRQLLFYPRALMALTGMLVIMAMIPGLPMTPFLILASGSGTLTYLMQKYAPHTRTGPAGEPAVTGKKPEAEGGSDKKAGAAGSRGGDQLEEFLNLDTFQIELGYALVSLADARKGGDLLERVTGVRRTFAQEMGIIIPPIRLRDNLQLGGNEYRFLLKGNAVGQGELTPGSWLAMNATQSKTVLKGTPTVEPVFQLPATWISEVERKNAEMAGYTVVDCSSVLVTHLSETLKRQCHEILSRQDVQVLLDHLKQSHPTVVNELIPTQLTVGQVQRVLQNLLAEGVAIRNLAGILEKISDFAGASKNPDELSEQARRVLSHQITKPLESDKGKLHAITLDPKLEQQIAQGLRQTQTEIALALEPKLARHLAESLSKFIQQMINGGLPPVVICSPQIRLAFRRFFATAFSDLFVLSYNEIPPRVDVQSAGVIPVSP